MNVSEYIHLMNKPDAVNEQQTVALEKIVQEFPYFQSARALYLKGLYNQNSFKYNYALKIAAAHTTDRSVLFDFITSDTFTAIQKELYDQKSAEILEIPVAESQVLEHEPRLEIRENTVEESIAASIREASPETEPEVEVAEETPLAETILSPETGQIETFVPEPVEETSQEIEETSQEAEEPQEIEGNVTQEAIEELVEAVPEMEFIAAAPKAETPMNDIEEKLEIGKPLEFSLTERHSFQEWLQLSKFKPIEREEATVEPEAQPQETEEQNQETDQTSEVNFEKQKKNELIDKFIETNPRIPQVKHDVPIPGAFYEPSKADNSLLMTETLARVYLEQKKYHKAIQAYEILILKYPEKSSFFADRILDIKNLQQNNTQ